MRKWQVWAIVNGAMVGIAYYDAENSLAAIERYHQEFREVLSDPGIEKAHVYCHAL